jgi:hypothetical protein
MRHLIHATLAVSLLTASAGPLAQPAPLPPPSGVPTAEQARAALLQADQARFKSAMTKALRPLGLADGKLGSSGGAWLTGKLRETDILMIGESHGSGSVAETIGLIVDALPDDRPLAYALETSPAGAVIQEALLRGPAARHEAYMADPRRAISFAFLNLREEADLARKILVRSGNMQGALWGLDQEFATSAPILLDRLESWARTSAQRTAIAEARGKVQAFMALANLSDGFYAPLDAAFAKGPAAARRLLADMRFSTQVYRLQESAPALSNRQREDYMKRNFLAHWRAASAHKPRVVMKFGAYHLTAGLSPTATPALGGFVNALALMDSRVTFSIMIVCGPDGQQIGFRGAIGGCREDFEATAGIFLPRLARHAPTLIDTAPLRAIAPTLRRMGVSEDIRSYIQSYDAIIVLSGAKAATPFARPLPSFFEGM